MKANPLTLSIYLLLCLVVMSSPSCSSEATDFTGKFAGDGLRVELHATGDGYAGSFTLQDKRFEATGQRSGFTLTGEFSDGTTSFPFTIVDAGDGMRLSTGGSIYNLQPLTSQNPLTKPTQANPLAQAPQSEPKDAATGKGEAIDPAVAKKLAEQAAATANALSSAPAFTKTYKHPSGVYFLYPDGWTAQPVLDTGVSLTPGDLYRLNGEPAELMLVVGDEAGGATRVEDPRIANLIEGFVKQTFPYLSRTGSANKATVGSQPILQMTWSGSVSNMQMQASMQAGLLGSFALGVFTLAPKDRFAAREKTMTDVLRTFGYQKPQSDPRLVGNWRYSKTYISGTFSSISVRNLSLNADGTCLEGGKLFAGMTHQGSNGENIGSSNTEGTGADYVGRWRTEGKTIVMNWNDGSSERWEFIIEANSMLWKDGKTRKLWERR